MAIFSTNPDPDYPVLNGPGFIQHTYAAQPQAVAPQQYYYNGQTTTPMFPQPQMGPTMPQSRRYDMTPAGTVPVSIPTPPQPQQVTYGFNQVAEVSRRNTMVMPPQPAAQQTVALQPGVSPWAIQSQPTQIPSQPEVFSPTMQTTPAAFNPQYAPLYQTVLTLDKNQVGWGAPGMVNAPCVPPAVHWNQQPAIPQPQACAYQMYAFPIQQQVSVQDNWEQIVQRNLEKAAGL